MHNGFISLVPQYFEARNESKQQTSVFRCQLVYCSTNHVYETKHPKGQIHISGTESCSFESNASLTTTNVVHVTSGKIHIQISTNRGAISLV
jgi:hypothetical protein